MFSSLLRSHSVFLNRSVHVWRVQWKLILMATSSAASIQFQRVHGEVCAYRSESMWCYYWWQPSLIDPLRSFAKYSNKKNRWIKVPRHDKFYWGLNGGKMSPSVPQMLRVWVRALAQLSEIRSRVGCAAISYERPRGALYFVLAFRP
jgi:hypothetical protein